jgi:hypothetical protein
MLIFVIAITSAKIARAKAQEEPWNKFLIQ